MIKNGVLLRKRIIHKTYKIPEHVKVIGNHAFYSCSTLRQIEIPNTVEKIGQEAFEYCRKLEDITIPINVSDIGKGTFSNCINLKKAIILSNKFEKLPTKMFYFCRSLEQVNIPQSIVEIGDSAFDFCESLKEVELPNGITFIGDSAFTACKLLEQINIPPLINSIEPRTFSYCESLKTVIIPEDAAITSIGAYAFEGCESLQELSFLDKIDYIDYRAFNSCSNLHLSIGTSLFYTDLTEFKETFGVKTLTLYNYNISLINYQIDVRKIRSRELQDKIEAYLKEHNISDARYFEYSLHKDFILGILTYLETIKNFDYRKEFNEYMNEFIKKIQNDSILLNSNFDKSLEPNNVSSNQNNQSNNNQNDVLDYLKSYAKTLGVEEKLYVIKKEIDGYLTIKNVSDAKSFSYDAHIGFIKEVLESLSHNKNYNYIEAINNYMQNYVESLNPKKISLKKREDATYKDIPISLYEYGKKLNLLNKIKEIKDRIDKCLRENGITDKQSFSYDKHQGFIREILECISSDSNYDYSDAIKNYVKYSILNVNNSIENQDALKEKENEIIMLRKQIEELNKKINELETHNMEENLGRKK